MAYFLTSGIIGLTAGICLGAKYPEQFRKVGSKIAAWVNRRMPE